MNISGSGLIGCWPTRGISLKQRVLNPRQYPLRIPPINRDRCAKRALHFLLFKAVPNRPSFMDTVQCPRNGFSRAEAWAVNSLPWGFSRLGIDKIASSVDSVPRPGHRSTETPLSQRGTSANRCARTAELPSVERPASKGFTTPRSCPKS
jgi:hypothetical protein